MSKIQKCPNLVRGGGQHFSKMSETQKCPKCQRGGGSTLIGTLSQIFSLFYFDASPKSSKIFSWPTKKYSNSCDPIRYRLVTAYLQYSDKNDKTVAQNHKDGKFKADKGGSSLGYEFY